MTDPRCLSEAALAAIGEQAEKATPGPWTQDSYLVVANVPRGRPCGEVILQCSPTIPRLLSPTANEANAAFITTARTAVPALLDHIAWQAERLAEAELTTSLDEEIHVENAHLWMEDRETIAGLRARLREAERDAKASADVVDQMVEGTQHWKGIADDLTAHLARRDSKIADLERQVETLKAKANAQSER